MAMMTPLDPGKSVKHRNLRSGRLETLGCPVRERGVVLHAGREPRHPVDRAAHPHRPVDPVRLAAHGPEGNRERTRGMGCNDKEDTAR